MENLFEENDWETVCHATIMICGGRVWIQGVHCECWYDGEECHNCGDAGLSEEELESIQNGK